MAFYRIPFQICQRSLQGRALVAVLGMWLTFVAGCRDIDQKQSEDALATMSQISDLHEAFQQGRHEDAVRIGEEQLASGELSQKAEHLARHFTGESYQKSGTTRFRSGDLEGALEAFDRLLELHPEKAPSLWQRGVTLYYLGRYEDGAEQFELHRTVNPEDVENAIWHMACVARSEGQSLEQAREGLIPVSADNRVPLREVHRLFAGTALPDDVTAATEKSGLETARFYRDLYIGLYYDMLGQEDDAVPYFQAAMECPFPEDTFMSAIAGTHLRARGVEWPTEDEEETEDVAEEDTPTSSATDIRPSSEVVREQLNTPAPPDRTTRSPQQP